MIGLFTTSRKALAGGLVAFLSPVYVLLQSEQDLTWRATLAALVAGLVGGLAVWAPANEDPYEPRHNSPEI